MIKFLDSKKKNFYEEISSLGVLYGENTENISASVSKIIADIEKAGDEKLLEYTNLFDQRVEVSVDSLIIEKKHLKPPTLVWTKRLRKLFRSPMTEFGFIMKDSLRRLVLVSIGLMKTIKGRV